MHLLSTPILCGRWLVASLLALSCLNAAAQPHAKCPSAAVAQFSNGVLSCRTTVVTVDVAPTSCATNAGHHACGVVYLRGPNGGFQIAAGRDHCDWMAGAACVGRRGPPDSHVRIQVSPTCPVGTTLYVDAGPGVQDRCRATTHGRVWPVIVPN
jgi:hypothetical protein